MHNGPSVSADEIAKITATFQSPAIDTAALEAWLIVRVDATDPVGRGHSRRVQRLVEETASYMGHSARERMELSKAALLHDVGKILVPRQLLGRPGPLNQKEHQVVRQHTQLGAYLLANIPALAFAAPVARWHHERWDGLGYPDGLSRSEVPHSPRFVAVLDALDAMTSPRAYSKPKSLQCALHELRAHSGTQFDPDVVDAVCTMNLEPLLMQFEQNYGATLCNNLATA